MRQQPQQQQFFQQLEVKAAINGLETKEFEKILNGKIKMNQFICMK